MTDEQVDEEFNKRINQQLAIIDTALTKRDEVRQRSAWLSEDSVDHLAYLET